MSQYQQELAQTVGRRSDALARQIERQQAEQTENFKSRMVATLPKRMATRAVSEWESRFRNIGETEANLWLLGIGDQAAKCLIPPDASDRDICDLAQ